MHAQASGLDSQDLLLLLGDLIRLSARNEARMKVQWVQVPEALALAKAATRPRLYSVGAGTIFYS